MAASKTSTNSESTNEQSTLDKAVAALKLRAIGPAFMGGRIADIAVHPKDPSVWYVAAGSGGVWKTTNAGVTWEPIFDDQSSYSIGCLAIDPNHHDTIWVGTGESVSGRHVAWGDGIYRSADGGKTWTKSGLEASEHIGGIVIDPRDSDRVFVAAEGPLWSSGGQRGVYRTVDGGISWDAVLTIDADTGVTSLVMAPDNPDVLYAAAYQRRRHVASFVGGGPGSGIYKSSDGGQTWRKLTQGLPEADMGKIGLAVTEADPNLVYATIEADEKERGFYRSTNRGESWERRNEYISGGTGPHYYQELFASPVDPDRVYQVDVFLHATSDGGKTIGIVETATNKHSDNHVVWIDPERPAHLLVGTDAGLYETFDDCLTFRHVSNLPISQFYRVAVDGSHPFYDVLAGAQDLGTLLGPSRTTNIDGVRNQDWTVPLGADGYHVAFHPTDPDTCYLEWQTGNVVRLDRRLGEVQDIQPQPAEGDGAERWNWDTPIVVSSHEPDRLYVASHRVWQSDDRGDSWTAISGDLTTDQNRYGLPTFGAVPSIDSLYDHDAMSWFSTITHLSESSLTDGLLYVGTDDGRIHVTVDGGVAWTEMTPPAELPEQAFINNIVASRHNLDEIFLAADDHKHGDFTPHLYRSSDRGATWERIVNGLDEHTIVWAIEQDHRDAKLLFAATEFGLYVTIDAGDRWHKLSGNVPTIAFRDLAIHRQNSDLVGASFGRGMYILDDYGPLRNLSVDALDNEAALFPIADAWWYVPRMTAQAVGQPTLGSTAFRTDNPPFGAVITYHLHEELRGAKKNRQAEEEKAIEDGDDVDFPGLESLWEEDVSANPQLMMLIADEDDVIIRKIKVTGDAGLHRVAWDLRRESPDPLTMENPGFKAPWEVESKGPLVEPGRFSAKLAVISADGLRILTTPQRFEVRPLTGGSGPEADTFLFIDKTETLARQFASTKHELDHARQQVPLIRSTIDRTSADDGTMRARLEAVHRDLEHHYRRMVEDQVRTRLCEPQTPTVGHLIGRVVRSHWRTTQRPTSTQVASITRAAAAFETERESLDETLERLDQLIADLEAAGGTWSSR